MEVELAKTEETADTKTVAPALDDLEPYDPKRDLVEGDGWTYGCLDTADLDAKRTEHLHDTVLVGRLLGHVDIGLAVVIVFLQQVERRIVIVLQS